MFQPSLCFRCFKISKFEVINKFNIRQCNESKINICLDNKYINKEGKETLVHFFGIFDGHGGSNCSEFLQDNFLKIVR